MNSKKLRPMKLDSGRVVCPVCRKELSHAGWYQHPCYKRHEAITHNAIRPTAIIAQPTPAPAPPPVETWRMWLGFERVQLWTKKEMKLKDIDRLIELFSMWLRWRKEDAEEPATAPADAAEGAG